MLAFYRHLHVNVHEHMPLKENILQRSYNLCTLVMSFKMLYLPFATVSPIYFQILNHILDITWVTRFLNHEILERCKPSEQATK